VSLSVCVSMFPCVCLCLCVYLSLYVCVSECVSQYVCLYVVSLFSATKALPSPSIERKIYEEKISLFFLLSFILGKGTKTFLSIHCHFFEPEPIIVLRKQPALQFLPWNLDMVRALQPVGECCCVDVCFFEV